MTLTQARQQYQNKVTEKKKRFINIHAFMEIER